MANHECRCVTREELADLMSKTVRQTLTEIGMDHNQPIELQRDMSFLRDLRRARDSVKGKALLVSIGVIATTALGAMALGIRHWFSGTP